MEVAGGVEIETTAKLSCVPALRLPPREVGHKTQFPYDDGALYTSTLPSNVLITISNLPSRSISPMAGDAGAPLPLPLPLSEVEKSILESYKGVNAEIYFLTFNVNVAFVPVCPLSTQRFMESTEFMGDTGSPNVVKITSGFPS